MKRNGELFEKPLTLWDTIRSWTGRPLLTKLLKEHGKDRVKEAGLEALRVEAPEAKEYLLAILAQAETPKRKHPWQMSESELMAFAQERGVSTAGKTTQQLINELR